MARLEPSMLTIVGYTRSGEQAANTPIHYIDLTASRSEASLDTIDISFRKLRTSILVHCKITASRQDDGKQAREGLMYITLL